MFNDKPIVKLHIINVSMVSVYMSECMTSLIAVFREREDVRNHKRHQNHIQFGCYEYTISQSMFYSDTQLIGLRSYVSLQALAIIRIV